MGSVLPGDTWDLHVGEPLLRAGPPLWETDMILILGDTNLCPSSCRHFRAKHSDVLIEECRLPDGLWSLKVKDGELLECPLGKWDLKVEVGVSPPIE
jgi:hypothetical protein